MKSVASVLAVVLLAMGAVTGHAQDSSSGVPASPPVPVIPTVPPVPSISSGSPSLQLSGSLEADYALTAGRTDSPLYRLQYYGASLSEYASSYLLDFYLNGDYRSGGLGVHFKTDTEYSPDNSIEFNLFELYGSLDLSGTSFLLFGKKMYSWGKGYAFNPVGYVNPKKDPENPDLEEAGLASLAYEYSKSLQSKALQNVALDLVIVPSKNVLNNGVSEIDNTDLAGKLYFLLWDTDIDLAGYYGRSDGQKAGFDFSRNIVPSLEIHGEASYFHDQPRYLISSGALQREHATGFSYLAGLRWLNALNMTTILEYYHNGAGMSGSEFSDYLAFLSSAAGSSNAQSVAAALNVNKSYFNSPTQMQDYLYAKLSWPEPFNLLDFSPAVFTIYNVADRSAVIGAPLAFSPVTNFTLTIQPSFFVGSSESEFGSKPSWGKLDLQADFSF